MTDYVVVRGVPSPTVEQIGREYFCCSNCADGSIPPTTNLLPDTPAGMEQIIELEIGDALDGPWAKRNKLGNFSRGYDRLNYTKHEVYKDGDNVRCRRMK